MASIEDSAGRTVLPNATAQVTVEKQDGFWVASPAGAVPILTRDKVETTVEDIRLRAALTAPAEG